MPRDTRKPGEVVFMSIRDIRKKTGLTQRAFAMSYRIPLQTLKQWESDSLSTSFRKPPVYVEYMLGRLVGYEFGQEGRTVSDRVAYLRTAAADSKYDAKLWFRYLRKELARGVRELTEHEVSALSEGNSLTMFQKISLRRALQAGTETNRYVIELNERAKTTMMDQLMRKPKKRISFLHWTILPG